MFQKLVTAAAGAMLCLTSSTASAIPLSGTSYTSSLDSTEILGNSFGTFVDNFDDNVLDPSVWGVRNPTVVESGGVVTFSSPGNIRGGCSNGYCMTQESSGIATDNHAVFDGQGDFTWTSTWLPGLPNPNQLFGVGFSYACIPGVEQCNGGLGMAVGNIEGIVADILGLSPGLNLFFYGGFQPPQIPLYNYAQAFSISPADITGEIVMQLAFNDSTDIVNAAFSLDGGASFLTPFSPVQTGPIGLGILSAGAQSWSLRSVPEPSTPTLFAVGIVGLGFAYRRKGEQ
jgi:hypothetical protein